MSGNRADLPAELRRVLAEIEHWQAFVDAHPHSSAGARRMLAAERDHAERVRASLRATGMPVEAPK